MPLEQVQRSRGTVGRYFQDLVELAIVALSSSRVRFVAATLAVAGIALAGIRSSGASPVKPRNIAVSPNIPDAFQQPSLAQNPQREGHLAVAYQNGNELNTCYLATSTNYGRTWRHRSLVGRDAMFPLGDDAYCWHPAVAYGRDGTLFYVFQDGFFFGEGGRKVMMIVSRDGGKRFEKPRGLHVPSDTNQFWPSVAVDERSGRVYVSWTHAYFRGSPNAGGPVEVLYSDDAGRTFSAPQPVSPLPQMSGGSFLATGADGALYVAYLDETTFAVPAYNQFSVQLVVAASDDGAETFTNTPIDRVAIGATSNEFDELHSDGPFRLHSIAAGDEPGEVYLAWWDERGEDRRARISFTSSFDGGRTWDLPRVIAIPPGGENDHQHRPWLSVAPDGRIDLAFYGRTPRDGPQSGPQDVYWSFSADDGETFSRPRKITTVPSDSEIGPSGKVPPGGRTSWGDVLAVASSNESAYIAWTDSRRGKRTNGHQDIYFARLSPPE